MKNTFKYITLFFLLIIPGVSHASGEIYDNTGFSAIEFMSVLHTASPFTPTTSGIIGSFDFYGGYQVNAGTRVVEMFLLDNSNTELDCHSVAQTATAWGWSTYPTSALTNVPMSGSQCAVSTGNTYKFKAKIDGSYTDASYYVMLYGDSGHSPNGNWLSVNSGALPNTNTRFISIQPAGGDTVSTSSPATVGAHVYINPADYEDGMYLQYTFDNQTVANVGGSALEAFNSAFGTGLDMRIPITATSTEFVIATSTQFSYPGVTHGTYKIVRPNFLSSLWFFGSFFNGDVVVASTTTFTVGAPTGLDTALAQGGDALVSYLLTGTTTTPVLNCSFSGFDLTSCLVSIVVPSQAVLTQDLNNLKDFFLTRVPIGYATRFISILSNSTEGTLPTFTVELPSGPLNGSPLTFDMDDMFVGGAGIINEATDANTGQNVEDIIRPLIQLVVALATIFIIVQDLFAMGTHRK